MGFNSGFKGLKKKKKWEAWTGVIWLRTETGVGVFVNAERTVVLHTMWGIS